jgi:regulator of protease activity HflC (stomatin/prohibitin superfamily)
MVMVRVVKVREHERGLVFRNREFRRVLRPGWHVLSGALFGTRVERVSVRGAWLQHADLDVIVKSGALGSEAQVLDLNDHERALVWLDGRLAAIVGPGRHALWTVFQAIKIERFDARSVRFEHQDLPVVLTAKSGRELVEVATVAAGFTGLLFHDGRLVATLQPGVHAFWKGEGLVRVLQVDLREQSADAAGQEIMTADRVTLRLNALVTYKVVDAVQAVTVVEDYTQALYRQAQLVLRAVVGTRDLDQLLADKDGVARQLEEMLRARATGFGIEVRTVGIRDIILPGEMKDILNRVTEARKVAEAAFITRREETAAIRSQANTAKVFENNPTLMRLRELEVLEKVAAKANLSIVLGDGGLAERVVKML